MTEQLPSPAEILKAGRLEPTWRLGDDDTPAHFEFVDSIGRTWGRTEDAEMAKLIAWLSADYPNRKTILEDLAARCG